MKYLFCLYITPRRVPTNAVLHIRLMKTPMKTTGVENSDQLGQERVLRLIVNNIYFFEIKILNNIKYIWRASQVAGVWYILLFENRFILKTVILFIRNFPYYRSLVGEGVLEHLKIISRYQFAVLTIFYYWTDAKTYSTIKNCRLIWSWRFIIYSEVVKYVYIL